LVASRYRSVEYKRSIYVTKDIEAGEVFTKENIRVIRPGYGLAPKFYDLILGKTASKPLKSGTPLAWENL